MRKALLFDDLFAFCDFVRLHGSGARSKSGYRLYHLEHPHSARRTLLALVGFNPRGAFRRELLDFVGLGPGDREPPGPRRARIVAKDGRATVFHLRSSGATPPSRSAGATHQDAQQHDVAIRHQSREATLLALIRPAPWPDEPEAPPHLLFWLRRDRLLAPLVTASLRLGNDRMRYADVNGQGKSAGATMLRIEQPSYFLVQQVVEDLAREIELYYPAAEDLYLPWGLAHPLAELWQQSQHERPDAWTLFRPDGSRRQVEPPRWHDVYDATHFEIELGEQRLERQVAAEHRIEIHLELVTRSQPGEPELWLLVEDDRPRLEALLAGVDEEDLANLALSVHADAGGHKLYVVREKRGRRRFLDFGGRGFAAYKGFANLYLPVDRELLPQLRRDRYRDLFRLRSGEIALVVDAEGTGVTLYRLDESSFEPIEELIDYIAADADEELEELVKASVFDLGPYLKAPSHPGLQPLAQASPETLKRRSPEAERAEKTASGGNRKDRETGRDDAPATDEKPPDPESREIQAERALLAEGQSFERWLEVLEAKLASGKHEDAAVAFVDTLWLAEDAGVADPLIARWHRFLGARQGELSDPEAAFVTVCVLSLRKQRPSELDVQLRQAGLQLNEVGGRMRLKLRWLLWREVLSLNRDVRRQARVREEIRQHLSQGLSQAEMPAFLRLRLFDDSRFGLAGDDADRSAAEELAAATRCLDTLARQLREKSIGNVALAIVARAFARTLGRADLARAITGEAPPTGDASFARLRRDVTKRLARLWRGAETAQETGQTRQEVEQAIDPKIVATARAWHELYCAHGFEQEDPGVAAGHRKRFEELRAALDTDSRDALDQLEEDLARREKIDNPTALLSAENAQRFFPQGGSRASGELGQLVGDLRLVSSASLRDDAGRQRIFGLLTRVFDEYVPAARDLDPVDLAELLDATLDVLGRVRWESEALPFLRRFEVLADQLARFHGGDRFYFALKNSSLARGLTELGHERRAAELITDAFEDLAATGSPIDLIDGSAALLNAVEGLALERRAPLIEAFTTSLRTWLEPESVVEQSYSHLSTAFYRLFDQAAEAGVSKDKLALGLFRRYQQHDEFLILDRILRDNPTEGEA